MSPAKGQKHTAEAKRKISEARKGKKRSPLTAEHKAKISAANKGKVVSAETRQKISAVNKGRKASVEARDRMSASQKRRWTPEAREAQRQRILANPPMSQPEARAKVAAALLGHTVSAETRAKISKTNKGRALRPRGWKHTAEAKAKMSSAKKGKKLSAEHKAKISAAGKGRKVSSETIAKIVAFHTGRKRSAETCAKIGAASKGRKWSEEQKQRASDQRKGKPTPWLDDWRQDPATWQKIRDIWAANGRTSVGQRKLYEILLSLNIPFLSEQRFTLDPTWAFVDAFIPSPFNLGIEYDGHQIHYTPEGRAHDQRRDKLLLSMYGIQTLRIGRKEVFTDSAIARIAEFMTAAPVGVAAE